MEKKSHTFMQALKLWLIWAMVANTSLVVFVVGIYFATDRTTDTPKPLSLVGIILFVGLIQWLAFIPRIEHSYWWILATALGWFVAMFLFLFYIFAAKDIWPTLDYEQPIEWILVGATAGAVIGLLQWLVLWRQVQGAGWWILGSVLGWASVGWGVYLYGFSYLWLFPENAILIVLCLLSMGMITGVAYAYLFTQPSQKYEELKYEQYHTRSANAGQ